uniref:Uncharacterized protein n=1 Tax=viral metagenome TaxID=1070528 RepID=A0A6C0JTJ4_9ZZZZ
MFRLFNDRWVKEGRTADDVRRFFEETKADPSTQNNYAIRWAAYNGHADVVRLLLEDPRVDPSAKNNDALQYACSRGYIDIVRLLLADPRIDPSDQRALRSAKRNNHTEIINLLTEHQFRLDGPEYNKNIIT